MPTWLKAVLFVAVVAIVLGVFVKNGPEWQRQGAIQEERDFQRELRELEREARRPVGTIEAIVNTTCDWMSRNIGGPLELILVGAFTLFAIVGAGMNIISHIGRFFFPKWKGLIEKDNT